MSRTFRLAMVALVTGVMGTGTWQERWSHFLTQPAKVDSPTQRTTHHEDAETVFG
jgi:hypothetical protein